MTSRLATQRDLASGRLLQVTLSDLVIRRPLHVASPINRAQSPSLKTLLDLI
jgi:hypothetical protein